jgi:SAM-dependent methyltransferase
MGKKYLRKTVWTKDMYFRISHKGSLDVNHPGMKILKELASRADSILDLGCGEGTRLNLLVSRGRGVGIDISSKAISLAKKKYPNFDFRVGDLEKLPLKNKSFDLVYSAFVFEHLDNPEKVIKEAVRVLTPGGKFVVIAPNYGAPNRASPPFKGNRLAKLLVGCIKDILPKESLGWKNVVPIATTKAYEIDWDTTIEPYMGSLMGFLRSFQMKIISYNSCWSEELKGAGHLQRLFRFLGEKGIYPFNLWGPHLVLVVQKGEEKETCPLCGGHSYKNLFDVGGASVVSCTKCGLTKTKNFSTPDYTKYHRDKDYQKFEWLFKNFFLKRIKTIEEFHKGTGKVLEIGCSTGTFLELFKNKGWEVWGIEPSKSGEIARKKRIKVVNAYFERAEVPTGYFDIVILNHTLEHLENPVVILQKVKTVLKKDGIVFVDVPNFGSLSSKILRKHWGYLAPTEHLWHFTPDTLTKLFIRAGLKRIYKATTSGIFDCGNPLRGLIDKLLRGRKTFFSDLATTPIAYLNTKMGMGTSLTMIGKK